MNRNNKFPAPRVFVDTPLWSRIVKFEIFSANGDNRLYANGKQQLKLIVAAKVGDHFNRSIKLSSAELDSIVLVDALTNKPLEKDTRGDKDWQYSEYHDARYRPLPYNGPIKGSRDDDEFTFYKEFYVTTNALSSVKLKPRITRFDGEMFYSPAGSDLGALELAPLPPAVYHNTQYSIRSVPKAYSGSDVIDRVECFFLSLIQSEQQIEFVYCNINSQLQIGSGVPEISGYYGRPYLNGRSVQTGYTNWEEPRQMGYAESRNAKGSITFVMVYAKRNAIDVRETLDNVYLEAVDFYGNTHKMQIRLTINPLAINVG